MEGYIKGTFKKIIFSSNDGYIVGLIKITDTNEDMLSNYKGKLFTFTGVFPMLNIEDDYVLYGNIVNNKYGMQYNVLRYEKIMPQDKEGLVTFLASDIFPGVGEKTAKQVVDYLGEDCLNIIVNDYEKLLIVPKMTMKKALDINKRLIKYNESFEMIVYLTNFGFSIKESLKIYNYYKENTIRILESNPYELIDNIDGITFNKIDSLKNKLNIDDDDERRLLSLIIYIISDICFKTGDTKVSKNMILSMIKTYDNLNISDEKLDYYLIELNSVGKIIIEDDFYMLSKYYKDEVYIAHLAYFLANSDDEIIDSIESKIEKLENYFDIKYNDEQKKAIKQAIVKKFSIITGGPGTGKTTIIKGITQLYKMISGYSPEKLFEKMILLAPTGRASKRMSEACLYPASTIHRYLKWNKETNEFGLNERHKSKAEFIIVDEVSMIDTNLLASLFKAITKTTKLVFIGDYNQLESVGPGKVLKDFIDSDVINTIFLKEIYRQDENSYITNLAYEVNKGELSESFLTKKDDYNFIKCDDNDILKATCDVAKLAISKGYDIKNVQILAPVYKGINGIDNLNKHLQSIFNPKTDDKNEVYDLDVIYREGDKVLQLENMIDDNVFNGDIGFIEKIEDGILTVDFDGNKVKYQKKDYKSIKHGYAISIHKSQGSEFDIVIMPVTSSYKMMLYKKIVYTGITRAKKSLILIGDPNAFQKSIYNKINKERNTNLKKLILDNINV